MNITFFTVGGTIDKVYFDDLSQYEVGESEITTILEHAKINFEYTITSLFKKDSLDMTHQDRLNILEKVQNEKNDRIIITHGTDTMIKTAQTLQSIKKKVIVLTGAMEPAKFSTSDAIFNLGSAVAAVQTALPGVYLSMSGRIFTPDNVRKNRETSRFEEKM